MKKLLLFCCSLILSGSLTAQVNVAGNTRVKLSDVIANYKKTHPDYSNGSVLKSLLPGLPTEENEKDYQFGRWLWYWKQHTDPNGYLVSPAKTWQEWQKAKGQQRTAINSGARTTAGSGPSWAFMGPDSSEEQLFIYGMGVGRVNVVAFDPVDSNIIWIGTPGGGAWVTKNNGLNWTSMTDSMPLLSVSDIVINPLNPQTMYLCTGDRDGNDYFGIGVLKSYDGGVTWNTTGLSWPDSNYNIATSMVINPLDTNTLIMATTSGMYRSYDGGNTVALVDTGNYYQVLYCPGDTNILYGTTFNYYGPGSAQIWRSTDAGTTWTQQTHRTTTNRITIAVTPAAPNIVMGVGSVANGSNQNGLDGIYKSSDSGSTFATIDSEGADCTHNLLSWQADGHQCTGQGWYTLPLAISPIDSNIVYSGGVNTWRSTDGGHTWSIANQWDEESFGTAVVHADKHWMAFNPIAPDRFYEGNDGGIFYSSNPVGSGTWNDLNNRIGIEEIYRIGVSNVASFVISGAQDVGTKITRPGGIYEEACFGDGMACQLDFADSTVGYGSSEGGSIYLINPTQTPPALGTNNDIASNIDGGIVEGSGGWVTPFILEPSCHECILAGYAAVWRTKNEGNTWSAVSPSLTTTDLYRVAATAADTNTIFATEDNYTQKIYYTYNGGTSWTTMTSPYAGSQYISDLKVDPRDKNHIWVTYSGYGSPQVATWDSVTGIWTQMNEGLPDVPVMCFAIDYLSRDIYVGTEIGVYYRDSTMTSWAPYTSGMPSLEVTDLEINYATNELWASTYGRSIWRTQKNTITVLPTSVMNIVPFAPDAMTISPNPNHGNFTVIVTGSADKQVNMHLTDAAGKIVWHGSGMLSGGKINVTVPGLIAGTYIFEMDANNVVEGKQKLVVY